MRIGVTYDLKDEYRELGFSEAAIAEFDSRETIDGLCGALTSLGHECVRIGHVKALTKRLAAGERWDLVFNIAEGVSGFGRESQVPALLEAFGIPYTFSDPLVCALTLHKGICKQIARAGGIATPDFAVVAKLPEAEAVDLPLPLFVKPVAEGTSKGIDVTSVVTDKAALVARCADLLRRFEQPVLVERFLPGREFTVGILGTGGEAKALGTLEVVLREAADAKVYSYRNKSQWQQLVDYRLLERGALCTAVDSLALAAWRCLGCRDAGRVDVRLDAAGEPQLIEINPLAGLTPGHSDLPIMADLLGLEYRELIRAILECALRRLGLRAEHVAAA
jgi:D-alanine-D-alanine ligase